jgi:hypothetical protein
MNLATGEDEGVETIRGERECQNSEADPKQSPWGCGDFRIEQRVVPKQSNS